MDLGTNDGDVDLGTNEGDVDLGTNEGDVDLGSNDGDVDLGTNEGDVDLGTNEGDVDLGTNEGDVDLGTGVVLGGVDGDENGVGGLVDIRLMTVVGRDGLILVGYNRTNFIRSTIINTPQCCSAD